MGSMDVLYPLVGALIVVIFGFFLIMKSGSKIGWLFVAGALIWTWFILQPVIRAARTGTTTPQQNSRGYYRKM